MEDDDMLVEILTKLPLKRFIQSKYLSKSWYNHISQNYTRNKLPKTVSGVTSKRTYVSSGTNTKTLVPTDLKFLPFSSSTLVHSSNGLLLFLSSSLFHVFNPFTKQCVTLPRPPFNHAKLSLLVFDPCVSRHFMVVSFVEWLDQGARIGVFDSRIMKWGEHEVHWRIDTGMLLPNIRVVDGVVMYIMTREKCMVRMNLDSFGCEVVELPEAVVGNGGCLVGKFGGRLGYSVREGKELRVWVMMEGKGWVMRYCVGVKMEEFFNVLGFDGEKDVVYMSVGMKLVRYDLCEEREKEVWEIVGEEKGCLVNVWVFPFTRNLEDCFASIQLSIKNI